MKNNLESISGYVPSGLQQQYEKMKREYVINPTLYFWPLCDTVISKQLIMNLH